jgi:RNA polymerase sigma factor (sigma-70 family)
VNAGAAQRATTSATDAALVAAVRAGEESAFEELFRRYHARVYAFVRRRVRDEGRAEDITQEAFLNALRRLRETHAGVSFRPWIYEIARNSTIDHFRRVSRADEVSVDAVDQLRATDHLRLVTDRGPEREVAAKQQLEALRGAFDELSDRHVRILLMRELEGLSYREIGERMQLSRPGVESTLFRARRRLETEFAEVETGRRCLTARGAMKRLAEGLDMRGDRGLVKRHVRRCATCNARARELGLVLKRPSKAARVAGILPLPFVPSAFGAKAAALVATAVLVGGGASLEAISASHAARSDAPPRFVSQGEPKPAAPSPERIAARPARARVGGVAARVPAAEASSARFASPAPQPVAAPAPVKAAEPRLASNVPAAREVVDAPGDSGAAGRLVDPGPQSLVKEGETVLHGVIAPTAPAGPPSPASAPPVATAPALPLAR